MAPFPSAEHLASWAEVCPGNDESAGKRRLGDNAEGESLASKGPLSGGLGCSPQ
jgi:transposase